MHVCVVLLTGLGDVVHGLPVVNALKRARPETRITWIVEPMPAPILQPHGAIDQVIVFHKKRGWRGVRDLRRRLEDERFDVTLNLNIYFKSIFPTLLSRAPVRWTFGRDRARDGVWLAGTHRLPARPRRHIQDMFLEFVEVLGIEPQPIEWKLVITDEERAEQARFVDALDGRPAVALVPASKNARKDWPPERYVPVVDALEHELGARALLVGGASQRETDAAHTITARAATPPIWMLGDPVRRMMWVLDACAAVVGPDTGPLHLARALDTPAVGLYGHTNPWRNGPYRAGEDLWIDTYTDPGTPPDPANRASKLGRMERIQSADVIERVTRALARARARETRPAQHTP